MVKTNAPSKVTIAGKRFDTNALPDQFDENDLVYRPKLQVLPVTMDRRAGRPILDQLGQSCTGQAVASLIETVLSTPLAKKPAHGAPRKAPPKPVSPYMLYAMARRYDEYPGDADLGSSLRGAFKGWYYHGVCSAETWTSKDKAEKRNFEDPAFLDECWTTPLGAYYRVNARRIDDMQSAITELNAIAASAAIHAGWIEPEMETGVRKPNHVIKRFGEQIGGHAFLIAGYNDRGFLVQNSWGTKWGDGGYATLPYEDWLDNGYDAWVARPGVPQVGTSQRRRVVVPTGRTLVTGTGPNVGRLKSFVIDITKGGRLSDKGKVSSSPTQLKGLAADMEAKHDEWAKQELAANPNAKPKRRVVFYAHGGLVGEAGGIAIADRMINWWLQNHIYPVHIVWESDAITTIFSFLDPIKEALFGFSLDGIWERLDRKIEAGGRKIQQLWEEMKHNAELASAPLTAGRPAVDEPGVSQFINLLKAYRVRRPEVEVHLVGHSAGSVVLAAVVERLVAEGITVESMQLMGGAIPVDEFIDKVVPSIQAAPNQPGVRRFTAYDLDDHVELGDTCPSPPIVIYHKSLLYFVSRALEPARDEFEKPMVGLSKFVSQTYPLKDGSRKPLIDVIGGSSNLVVAPTNDPNTPVDSKSMAKGHADFDDDPDTMTSVVLRIMQTRDLSKVKPYPQGGMPTGSAVGSLDAS